MKDLSILIPARNEMFLKNTIEDALKNIEANTEIIAVLDGQWVEPPISQHERVNLIYVPEAIGQRAAQNLACRLSKAKYVMKLDAHCSFDKGFDRKMIEGFKEFGDNVTMVPIMRNLWAFDWKCIAGGTDIVTPKGLVPIEKIKKDDYIISGDGRPHKVLFTNKSKPTKKLVEINPNKLLPITLTEDHLVKVYKYKRIGPVILDDKAIWIEAGKLKDGLYRMIFTFPTEENKCYIEKNQKELIRFLGYYVAEGNCYHKDNNGGHFKVTLCFNQKETNIVDEIEKTISNNFLNRYRKSAKVGKFLKIDPRNGNKYLRVNIYSKKVSEFVKRFVVGNTAKTKKFVPEVLTWPRALQKELLNALIIGDGCTLLNRKNKKVSYTTVSKELAYQVFTIMLRLGYMPGICKQNLDYKSYSKGGVAYQVYAYSNDNGFNTKSTVRGNEYIVSIYKLSNANYDDYVYDLSIEGLPEIQTIGGIVHNCMKCGKRWYQGPTPTSCQETKHKLTGKPCDGKDFKRKMIWIGKERPQSTSYCFDKEPHFQYFREYAKRPEYKKNLEKTGFTETMSLQGSCFMAAREKYWELELCDEKLGNWGNQGIEAALKTWLSGGRVLCNHKTWYAHMFRTQGGDFGFPWPNSGRETQKTKKNVKNLLWSNEWPKQKYPLSWLVEKFWPVKGWTEEDLANLKKLENKI